MHEALRRYGLVPGFEALFAALDRPDATLNRVVRQDRGHVLVTDGNTTAMVPTRVRRTGAVVAGDWVAVESGVVTEVLSRTSVLSRGVASRDSPGDIEQQPLVANVDVVFVVCGLDRPISAGRIQRAVTQSREADATPVVILTKCDTPDAGVRDGIKSRVEAVRVAVPAIDVVVVSSKLGRGIDGVREMTIGRTAVMIGESGAGKSTLLNALLDQDVGDTGAVRDGDARGRHTTVRRELHLVPGAGVIIDTPGVRSMGLWADAETVDTTFDDIAELADQCRFADCAHDSEPGCMVSAAVSDGRLDEERLSRWRVLRDEAAAVELRRGAAARTRRRP